MKVVQRGFTVKQTFHGKDSSQLTGLTFKSFKLTTWIWSSTFAFIEKNLKAHVKLGALAGSFRVRLFIDLGCPENLGTGPEHFYDK